MTWPVCQFGMSPNFHLVLEGFPKLVFGDFGTYVFGNEVFLENKFNNHVKNVFAIFVTIIFSHTILVE